MSNSTSPTGRCSPSAPPANISPPPYNPDAHTGADTSLTSGGVVSHPSQKISKTNFCAVTLKIIRIAGLILSLAGLIFSAVYLPWFFSVSFTISFGIFSFWIYFAGKNNRHVTRFSPSSTTRGSQMLPLPNLSTPVPMPMPAGKLAATDQPRNFAPSLGCPKLAAANSQVKPVAQRSFSHSSTSIPHRLPPLRSATISPHSPRGISAPLSSQAIHHAPNSKFAAPTGKFAAPTGKFAAPTGKFGADDHKGP